MTGRKKVCLTGAGVARLKPGKTEYIVRDSRVAGLGVRVRPDIAASSGINMRTERRYGRPLARPR